MTSIYPSTTTSSSSSTSSANLLRISGMASGIDTDSVVKQMVANYQAKIDKANQDKQSMQWKQDAYRDIIKGIKGLQDYFDPLSSKYMLSGKSLNINTATSDDSSIVSATSGSTAKAGTYNVKVSQLASQAKIEGSSKNSMISVTATKISEWTNAANKLTFEVDNGSTVTPVTLDSLTGTNTKELVADLNKKLAASDLNGKITASYVQEGGTESIKFIKDSSSTDTIKLLATDNASITDIKDTTINSGISSSSLLSSLGFATGNINFTLRNGTTDSTVSLAVDSSATTVQNLIDQVNSATSGAVTMNIDDTTGKISFQSKKYGSASSIKITDSSSTTTPTNNVITNLGILTNTGTGTDAIVSIKAPGQSTATTTTQSSNQFTMNGVSYNLVGVNDAVTNPDSNVTVTANSDTVVSNVKKFIDDYNSVISTINTKLTEKKNSDYKPLTDAQKESMSESQITAWETKAKVGILRNDDYLSSLMTELRGVFSSPVYSSYDSANTSTGKVALSFGQYASNSIGIDTSTDYTDGGKLVLKDETKLKSVIENNLEDFKKLFIGSSSITSLDANQAYSGSKKYNEDGILTRMDNTLRSYVAAPGLGEDGTYTLAGSMNIFVNKQYDYSITGFSGKNTLPDQVYSKTVSISKYQTQLKDAQTRYYAKFTALETAMNTLNSQQSQLSSMLGA